MRALLLSLSSFPQCYPQGPELSFACCGEVVNRQKELIFVFLNTWVIEPE
jgi:hypothetical protein